MSLAKWCGGAAIVALSIARGFTMQQPIPPRAQAAVVQPISPHCGQYILAFKAAAKSADLLASDETTFHYSMPYKGSQRETRDIAARAVQDNGCIR